MAWVAGIGGLCGVLATLAVPLADLWWPLEIVSHFRVQTLAVLILSGSLLLAVRRPRSAAVCALLAAVNLALVLPLYLPPPRSPADGAPTLRLMTYNVFGQNRDYESTLELVRAQDPDVAMLLEVTPGLSRTLQPLGESYSFAELRPEPGSFGLGLLSRVVVHETRIEHLGRPAKPAVLARLEHAGREFSLIGVHTMPPKGRSGFEERNSQLVALGRLAAAQAPPVVVVGDLNVTSWSPFFGELLRAADLRDSRRGFGVHATWPALRPWLGIPIDHVLVSAGVTVRARAVGPPAGSDHLAVICEISLPD